MDYETINEYYTKIIEVPQDYFKDLDLSNMETLKKHVFDMQTIREQNKHKQRDK